MVPLSIRWRPRPGCAWGARGVSTQREGCRGKGDAVPAAGGCPGPRWSRLQVRRQRMRRWRCARGIHMGISLWDRFKPRSLCLWSSGTQGCVYAPYAFVARAAGRQDAVVCVKTKTALLCGFCRTVWQRWRRCLLCGRAGHLADKLGAEASLGTVAPQRTSRSSIQQGVSHEFELPCLRHRNRGVLVLTKDCGAPLVQHCPEMCCAVQAGCQVLRAVAMRSPRHGSGSRSSGPAPAPAPVRSWISI